MTRRLILIRHAKSGWDGGYADDRGRPLSERGRKAGLVMGEWLRDNGYVPDLIISSDATRTVQTTALLQQSVAAEVDVKEISTLYLAAPQTMIDLTKIMKGATVALVGHNPGIAMMAEMLASEAPDHPRFADYPTGAMTVMDFPDDAWCDPGQGTVVAFAVPRELD